MVFCDGIEKALNCKIGVYDLSGRHIFGEDYGYRDVDDVLYDDGHTYVRCGRLVVCAGTRLSQDACNLIRLFLNYEYEKEAANYMQPLEYVLKNSVPYEELKGRYKNYNAFYIKSDKDIKDVLLDVYDGYDVEFVEDDSGIYMVRAVDDIDAEADSIVSGMRDEKGINVIVGSGRIVNDRYTVKHSANHAKLSADLAAKLGYKSGHYPVDKMIIYGLVNSIDDNIIDSILYGGYSGLNDVLKNRELINTAEEFLKCDLNISEASRRLYIHRNTLLYRIEKIKNLTGLDIKNFDEAMILRMLLAIYKLKRK